MRSFWLAIALSACGAKAATTPAPPVTYGKFGLVSPADVEASCHANVVESAACNATADADVAMDASSTDVATSGTPTSDYGPTHTGAAATDDDCKYTVTWQSSGALAGTDVYFQIDVANKADGTPATHLAASESPVYAEAYIDNGSPLLNHPAPNSGQKSGETEVPGRYVVGPIRFDSVSQAVGLTRWTVRFHLYPQCDDGDNSPHGHVAFFFDVMTPGNE
jgi:hypothetical protein